MVNNYARCGSRIITFNDADPDEGRRAVALLRSTEPRKPSGAKERVVVWLPFFESGADGVVGCDHQYENGLANIGDEPDPKKRQMFGLEMQRRRQRSS